MRIFILFCMMLLVLPAATAQIHEIGALAGGSNFIGDVGATNYIAPNDIALGVVYKWNKSSRYAYRASFLYASVRGDDAHSDIPSRQTRQYAFSNRIKEFSAGMEFNFLEFNLHKYTFAITPYIHSGLSYFIYNAQYFDSGEAVKYDTYKAVAIPMAAGVKSNLFGRVVVGLEVNVRYTFTDNLDGSNPPESELSPFRFGNVNSNDWFVFSGLSITYTFGRNPCYCIN